jgi:predicted dehydrogenase
VFLTHGGEPPVAPHVERLTFDTADPYGVEADAFAAAVLDGGPMPIAASDAVANMRVIERVLEAAEART